MNPPYDVNEEAEGENIINENDIVPFYNPEC